MSHDIVPPSGVEPERFTARDFLTTLCYHSHIFTQIELQRLLLSQCCGLEYIFTILKFLQDSMIGVKLNRLILFNTKFQLRYLLYTLYTFMIGGKYCNTPSVFSVLSIQHGIILTHYWLVLRRHPYPSLKGLFTEIQVAIQPTYRKHPSLY